ncbi:peptide chain release factor N(5)-glutamine methyltransferase [bacterium]|nr:peptide chain release factor N(5)-glutamine methyltransferase [bacterium]
MKGEGEITYANLVQHGRDELLEVSATPQLESETLLSFLIKRDRIWLIAHGNEPVAREVQEGFSALLRRRRGREPVAYIRGAREFYGRDFLVTPDVLIPRPETELLVEEGVAVLRRALGRGEKILRLLELGTGSGCITITVLAELMSELPSGVVLRCRATDISPAALRVAEENAHRLLGALPENISLEWLHSDWFESVPPDPCALILSNPPYVPEGAALAPDLSFEPSSALFSAEEGLADLKTIITHAPPFLVPGGVLLLEGGIGQWKQLQHDGTLEHAGESYASTTVFSDLQGIERVFFLRKRGEIADLLPPP